MRIVPHDGDWKRYDVSMPRARMAGPMALLVGACTFGSTAGSGTGAEKGATGSSTAAEGTGLDASGDTTGPEPATSDGTGCVPGTLGCACDPGCEAGLVCMSDVCVAPTCGDGVLDPGEQCDDGNPGGGDGCESGCTFTPGAAEIRAGRYHTCARFWDGTVECFGQALDGRLGYGAGADADVGDDETPASVGPVDVGNAVEGLCTGATFTCARLDTGDIRCWGSGMAGRLGNQVTDTIGDDEPASASPSFSIGGPAVALSCGTAHACAIRDDGALLCWGSGADGRLGHAMGTKSIGDDETVLSVGPVDVGGPVREVCAGNRHTCARLASGAVRCWGSGARGRLGYGDTDDIGDDETPASKGDVPLGAAAVEVDCGWAFTCARLDSGVVKCWGVNDFGQLGDGSTDDKGDSPDTIPSMLSPVQLDESVLMLSAGEVHACAVLVTGQFKCWGEGDRGRLATESSDDLLEPAANAVAVDPVLSATAISAGGLHTCARVTDGTVRCWGAGGEGQLGYGNETTLGDDPGETPDLIGPVPL